MTLVGQMPKKLFTGPGSLLSGLMRFFFFFLAVIHLSVNRKEKLRLGQITPGSVGTDALL